MKNFKGFEDWIEIFHGGKQIDSEGRAHDGDAIIDTAIQTFDPEFHEPPVVAGHPVDNAPAYGWVQGLKKTGHKLLAKIKDVVPEFETAVKKGMYKKRSASFYPDGRLRHIGFLGAAPPAVKGLADLSFNDNDNAIIFEFTETSPWTWNIIADVFRKMREWLIEKEGKETADSIIPEWKIEDIKDAGKKAASEPGAQPEFGEHKSKAKKEKDAMTFNEFTEMFKFWKEAENNPDLQLPKNNSQGTPSGGDKSFTEADIEAAKKASAEAERKKADAEFAEKERTAKREAHTKEISDFCEGLVTEGKIPPSWVDSGLVGFAKHLDSETEISFTEKGDKKSPADWFKSFLEGFGKSPIFQELATKEKAGDSADFAEAKQAQEIGESIAAKVNPV